MRTEQQILTHFRAWALENERVRAAVLTSSRVHPESHVDALSDYDIELYVTDLQPFEQSDDWLSAFGPIMVRWPRHPRSTFDERWITRLVLFQDGLRIDFQITDKTDVAPDAYDNGYIVLIDKDGLTANLLEPTYSEFRVTRPDRQAFETLTYEFWWDATYVPKYLWRDELPFAKYMLDKVIRYEYLHPVVRWYVGMQHGWDVNTGAQDRWFKRYLDPQTWADLEATYAGADIEQNWAAFFRTVELFRRLGTALADHLGYEYPTAVDRRVNEYLFSIRDLDKSSEFVRGSSDA